MDVRMPDGTVITNVPDNITQTELLARFNKFNAPKIETAGPLEAIKGGTKRMLGSIETGVSGIFGAEEAAKEGQARQEAITEKSGASLEKVKQVYGDKGFFPAAREAISQIPSAISEQAPQLATALGGARLGAMAGSAFGPAGTVIGGLGGAFVPSLIQQAGTNLERQAQEGKPISGGAAYGAAVPQAALDVFTDKLLFGKLMGIPAKALGTEAANKIVEKSLKRTIAEGTVKGVAAEVPTEVAQQMLERYQAGLSLTDDEARKEYAATAYQTALLGPLGAVGKLQERGEAKQVVAEDQAAQALAAQQAQAQAQRRATGTMDQQPLFTEEEAPVQEQPTPDVAPVSTVVPEPTTTPPTFGFDDEGKFVNEAPTEVSPDQGDLFTRKGAPTAEAKASVEAARVQGLPAQIQELLQTPEGKTELTGNMKMYFPDLDVKERNKTRQAIQQGTYGVEPVEAPVAPEGTLTPELLKTFDISPRSKQYKALEGGNLADSTTYNLLTTAASTNTDFGVKANRILEAFPQYKPSEEAATPAQPKPAEVANEQPQPQDVQPDLFGLPEDGAPVIEPGSEQGLGEPVQQQTAASTEVKEPVGGGVDVSSEPTDGNIGQPAGSTASQPSTLNKFPRVDAIPGISIGPGGLLKPKAVAEGSPLFHETNIEGLNKLLYSDRNFDTHGIFVSNNPDLAIGQGGNRGIKLEFRPNAVSGAENVKPGTAGAMGDLTGREYKADIIAPRAISKITVPNMKVLKGIRTFVAKTIQAQFDRVDNADGSITFTRKGLEVPASAPAPVQQPTPSALAPVPKKVARDAAAALKKEPVAVTWDFFSDIPFAKLSKVGKDKVKDAHAQGYLNQELADDIERIESANITKANVANKIATGSPEMAAQLTSRKLDEAIEAQKELQDTKASQAKIDAATKKVEKLQKQLDKATAEPIDEDKAAMSKALSTIDQGIQQRLGTKKNIMPEDEISMGEILSALSDVMYLLAKRGVKSLAQAIQLAKNELGPNANKLSDEQYKQAFEVATKRVENEGKPTKVNQVIDPQAQAQANQFIAGMSGTLAQSVPKVTTTPAQAAQKFVAMTYNKPTDALGMIESMVNRFRTSAIDKAANVSASIQDHNDGAFYDVNGQMRADLKLSAANNTNNYINSVFTFGDIDILSNGAIEVKQGKHSVDNIFRQARTLADRIGTEQMRELVTKTFYHYRAKSIIDDVPPDQWPENWQKDPRMVPTQAQINAAMAAFNAIPELRAMQREFIGSKNQMVDFLRKAGFLSPEKAKAFLADDSYAPWLRLKEYQDTMPGLGNVGKMVDLSQMKALVGGTEEVNDMLENMSQMIGWCVRSGISNHTANSALETMADMGTAVRHAGRPGSGNPAHVVMTYTDGKPTFWTVENPYDLAAFQSVKGLNSPVMRAIGKGLGTLRAGIVLFPAFPLRQVVMDSQRAFVEAGVNNPYAMVGKIYKSFLSGEAFRGQHQDIQKLMQRGVVGGADFTAMDTTRGRATQFGVGEEANSITDKWVRSPAYNFLHKLAYSADLAVRLGIYRQTLEETGDETLAATRAREIINFQKAGTSELMHTLKQTIPFLGAYLQGMDVNYRGMVGRGNSMQARKAAAKAYWGNMAMYAGLTIAYTMAMSGDDEYEDQKGYVTDHNFMIPGGGLLPIPPDVGFLAKVVPERITDYILQEGTDSPESARRLRQGLLQSFAAGYTPPAAVYGVTPGIELLLNKSFFSDMPIISQRMQGRDPRFQYTSSTSEIAKEIGDITGQSPLQIDYLFNAIGGTTAGALLQLADVAFGSGKMAPDKTPIISSFQQKTVGGRNAEEYYALREMSDRAYNTVQALAMEQNPEKLQEYLADPKKQQLYAMHQGVESIHAQLNQISRIRNIIEKDPNLSPEEKRQKVNELLANVESTLRAMPIRNQRAALE